MNGGQRFISWSLYILAIAVAVVAVVVLWNVYGKTKKMELEPREKKVTEKVSVGEVDEVVQVQKELQQIVERTNALQREVQANRLETQRILERAKIHERILNTLSVPGPVQTGDQVNVDRILQQEKVRLIAEQARQTQNQLQALERARRVQTVRTPSQTNSS